MSWIRRKEPFLWILAIVVAAAVAFSAGDPGARVNGGLVAATLMAILWYTFETRRMRISQDEAKAAAQLADELRSHPWLEATTLKPQIKTFDQEGKPSELELYLPAINRGVTPAKDMLFATMWTETYPRDPDLRVDTSAGQEQSVRVFLAPSDTAHFGLGGLPLLDRDADVAAWTRISYRTLAGGSGIVEQRFRGTIRGFAIESFYNMTMRYVVIDSTGRHHGDL